MDDEDAKGSRAHPFDDDVDDGSDDGDYDDQDIDDGDDFDDDDDDEGGPASNRAGAGGGEGPDDDQDGDAALLAAMPWEQFVYGALAPVLAPGARGGRVRAVLAATTTRLREGAAVKALLAEDGMMAGLVGVLGRSLGGAVPSATHRRVLGLLGSLYAAVRRVEGAGVAKGDEAAAARATVNSVVDAAVAALARQCKNLPALSPAVVFNHAKWTGRLLDATMRSRPRPTATPAAVAAQPTFQKLLALHGRLLDALSCGASGSDGRGTKRAARLLMQARKLTRRPLVLRKEPVVTAMLAALLPPAGKEPTDFSGDAAAAASARGRLLLLSVCLDVAQHRSWATEAVSEAALRIAQLFERAVLAAPPPAPPAVAVVEALAPTLSALPVFPELLKSTLLARAERQLLRSPERVLPLYLALLEHAQCDLAALLNTTFTSPLLVESALAVVAHATYICSLARNPTADQKQLIYGCIAALPCVPDVSRRVIKSLTTLAQKESTEQVLTSCYAAIGVHFRGLLSRSDAHGGDDATSAVSMLRQGLSDQRGPTRRASLHLLLAGAATSEAMAALGSAHLASLMEACISVVGRLTSAGLALLDPSKKDVPALVEGYLAVSWILDAVAWEDAHGESAAGAVVKDKKLFASLLAHSTSPKSPSWFLNEKFYHKLLHGESELLPFARCVAALVERPGLYAEVKGPGGDWDKLPLAHAVAFLSVGCASPAARRIVIASLKHLAASDSIDETVRGLCLARWAVASVVGDVEHPPVPAERNPSILTANSSAANGGGGAAPITGAAAAAEQSAWGDDEARTFSTVSSRLFAVLCSAVPVRTAQDDDLELDAEDPPAIGSISRALVDLAPLTCHPAITRGPAGPDAWIQLCLRAGLDPARAVELHGAAAFTRWLAVVAADPSAAEAAASSDRS
ncbi:hypothetical protein HK405_001280, partial [Cladochytrium tenue]